MNRLGKPFFFLAIVLIVVTASGCVLQQTIAMNANRTGIAATDLLVDDFFVGVLEDFQPLQDQPTDEPMMDRNVADFVRNLTSKRSVSNIFSEKIGPNSYAIGFDFSSLNQFMLDMNNQQKQNLLNVTVSGNTTTLTIYLDINTYPQLTKIIPFLADPNFETFGPLYNEGMSETDYLDMISYILGEDGPASIDASLISLLFISPKPLTRVSGGEKISPTTVRFDIPLIDFLLLAKPIQFTASW